MFVKKLFLAILPTVALSALPGLSRGDDATHVGIALTGGLSGVGVDAGVNVNNYLGVRGTISGLSIGGDGAYGTSISWGATLKLFQAGLLADAYPFQGVFRVSGGVIDNGNKISLSAQQPHGTYTFNGASYSASQLGPATASVEWRNADPYLGIGWGNLAGSRGLHFTSDVGILFSGSPKTMISVACASGQSCPGLAANVAVENAKLQNDLSKVSVWPVLRFGIGYAF